MTPSSLEATFFNQREPGVPRHQPVCFLPFGQTDGNGRDIGSILVDWDVNKHPSSPVVIIAHFARDVRETLLGIAVQFEAGALKIRESFTRAWWIDGRELLAIDRLSLVDRLSQGRSLILVDFSAVD